MATLAAPVAAVRLAVRRALDRPVDADPAPPGPAPERAAGRVLVACSGGADSLALAAAAVFVGPRRGVDVGLVTVDHGLQAGSGQRAQDVADWARKAGFAPVEVATVEVAGRPGGPEAAARDARYEALVAAAHRHRAGTVLLGHTRDDQAETVLLALARGAGPRGLAGMPAVRRLDGIALCRPLLDVTRAQTRAACAVLGLTPWDDPHNTDPSYARARVRSDLLPALVEALGPGVVGNLARTAALVAADTAALDALAADHLTAARDPSGGLRVAALAALPAALRGRVLHAWARELGAAPAALSHRHVEALDALITAWRGQGPTFLPGGIRVARHGGHLGAG
ncbi:tRNA lysidine(34) synthetase TilS [Polymorphospora rubra]|uniref:tRNA lysidine(34) synthetase TilS n=1 Tax=Polymorphospora rubra TaxID=338584 RepID=UPI00340AE3A5